MCFVFQKNVPRALSFSHQNVSLLLSLTYTHWLTANHLEGPGSPVCGASPPVSLASPAAFSRSTQGPWLVSGQALEGRFPFWALEPVPWGRDTASLAATEVFCKKLDALEPGQCGCWCTCHRRVCWHGLSVSRSLLVGVVLSIPPASCSSGFWFLRQSGFRDLGKSDLGG